MLDANRTHADMLTIALCPAGIFGEGDAQMLPGMLGAYDSGFWRVQLGDSQNLFDFTYVGNVAHAHLLATKALMDIHLRSGPSSADKDKRIDGEAFFITNDQPYRFWDFSRAVWAAAGHQVDPKDVWVIPKGVALMIATVLEWLFWFIFWGKRKPKLTRSSPKYSTLTRT